MDLKAELLRLTDGDDKFHANRVDPALVCILRDAGLIYNARMPDGSTGYTLSTEGALLIERPPKWLTDMSPRERSTYKLAWERTEDDYLTILRERPDVVFGEYDNVSLLFDMVKRGVIKYRTDKESRHTSMSTCLWLEIV